ncbi:MAG: orotate phosphoribosyltransferase [Chitinophagaceae bacterium]|nr:orotate phosphoribosyltransferase [Anaerolineae bacterium]
MPIELLNLLSARNGHFKLESGHHSDLWLELDQLFVRQREVHQFAHELADRLSGYGITAICGPLAGGAFVAQIIAIKLDVEFYYTERFVLPTQDALYPVEYRLPKSLRKNIKGKAVAIVDDVINAGSAVRGTFEALKAAGAIPIVIGALLVLGTAATDYFAAHNIPIKTVAQHSNNLWTASECPLCKAGISLEDVS